MATKPLKPCAHIGCSILTRSVYCDKHRPKDADRRSKDAASWHGWYKTKIFRKLRAEQLLCEPFCRECSRNGRRVRATDVDHIVPHRGCWSVFIDPNNLQSLCHSCHSRKTAAEIRQQYAENTR